MIPEHELVRVLMIELNAYPHPLEVGLGCSQELHAELVDRGAARHSTVYGADTTGERPHVIESAHLRLEGGSVIRAQYTRDATPEEAYRVENEGREGGSYFMSVRL